MKKELLFNTVQYLRLVSSSGNSFLFQIISSLIFCYKIELLYLLYIKNTVMILIHQLFFGTHTQFLGGVD